LILLTWLICYRLSISRCSNWINNDYLFFLDPYIKLINYFYLSLFIIYGITLFIDGISLFIDGISLLIDGISLLICYYLLILLLYL